MLVKLGSNISEVSGSIAGHTFQKSQGGIQVRNKPCVKRQPSPAQLFIRSIHSNLLHAWQNLTDNQRAIWNYYASHKYFKSRFGDKVRLSGQALFLKYQFLYAYNELPLISSPSIYNPNVLGPELILNPNFVTDINWVLRPGYTCPSVGLYVDSPVFSFINQWVAQVTGLSYRFRLECYDYVQGSAIFYNGNGQGLKVFASAGVFYNTYTRTPFADGNVYILNNVHCIFKIKNFSLRQFTPY